MDSRIQRISAVWRRLKTLAQLSRERSRAVDLLPGVYWHLTERRPAGFFFENVRAGRGLLQSMSVVRAQHGERLIALGDLYPRAGAGLEAAWEEVRAQRYPEKPSRRGAIFLFETRAAAMSWHHVADPFLVETRILRTASWHRGDFRWLAASEERWTESADSYWTGQPCDPINPAWEYVVDGAVFFPDWQDFPTRSSKAHEKSALKDEPSRKVACPACAMTFEVIPPKGIISSSSDRRHCTVDPDLPIISDCPNVVPLIQAARKEMEAR